MNPPMYEMDALEAVNILFIVAVAALWWYLRDVTSATGDHKEAWQRHHAMMGSGGDDVMQGRAAATSAPLRLFDVAGCNDPEFLDRVRDTYEGVVHAVAVGDLSTVEHLLADGMLADFTALLSARRIRGAHAALTLIGFRGVELVDSGVFENTMWADVRFSTDLVSVVQDRTGTVLEGDPHRVVHCAELWTFERDVRTTGARWQLAATDTDG